MKELVVINVKPGVAMESQSGIAQMNPRIYGAIERSADRRAAAIIMHPANNFMGHYLLKPLADAGITALGLNSRYMNNDSQLIMERVIQDLGAGVRYLRDEGYEKVLLIGNSGGAAISAFYQAQAEKLTLTATPAGDKLDFVPEDFPPIDGLIFTAAHPGRARLYSDWLDPSVLDERDPFSCNPALDMFNPDNGPPYSAPWLALYRAAQRERHQRLEAWARGQLAYVRSLPHGVGDMAFIVYRSLADPRNLDLSIEPNDRPARTTIWGDPRQLNYGANNMGRYTTLTSFLSQWAPSSKADGPTNLALTHCPVLLFEHTADAQVTPPMNELWVAAGGSRLTHHVLKGANHYLAGQPELLRETVETASAWVARL